MAGLSREEFEKLANFLWQFFQEGEKPDKISLEVFQHDWIPGFAAFHHDGDLDETAKAHVVLNLGTLLTCVETGELPKKDLPYMIAESLMHEAIHALEAWAKVEFSEEKVEALLEKYRLKYRPDGETHWQYDPEAKRENPLPAAPDYPLRRIPEDDFRTDFERTATYLCQLSITRDKEGHYIDANTLKAWICWRTALATLAAPDSRPSTEQK